MSAFSLTTKGALTTLEEPKFPAGPCCAVIVVEPPFSRVNVEPETVAIDVSATLKIQLPGELDIGGCKVTVLLAVDPKVAEIDPKVPMVGTRGRNDKFIEVEPDWYPFAGA